MLSHLGEYHDELQDAYTSWLSNVNQRIRNCQSPGTFVVDSYTLESTSINSQVVPKKLTRVTETQTCIDVLLNALPLRSKICSSNRKQDLFPVLQI